MKPMMVLKRQLTVLLLVYGLFAQAVAGQQTAPTTETESPAAAQRSPEVGLPASVLIQILRERPEVLVDVRRVVASALQAKGAEVSEDSITDEMLFQQINADAELRKALTSYLWSRGYITQTDLEHSLQAHDLEDNRESGTRTAGMDSQGIPLQTLEGTTGSSLRRSASPDVTTKPKTAQATELSVPQQQTIEPANADPNQPSSDGLLHQSTPLNLLALRDLYTQVPESTSSLRRFGSEAFLHHGITPAELPTDIPVGPDYILGPGDVLALTMWGSLSQTIARTVDHEGRITLPEAGPIVVAGLTLAQAEAAAEKALKPQFRETHVQLSLGRVRTVRIYVVGDVQRPGAYDVSSLSTALSALYAAGGPTAIGSLRTVRHYRNKELVREVDLYDFLLHGVYGDNERLEAGDTILIPPAGRQVTIAGMVRRPAIYELREERTLDDVIGLAGGLLVSASTAQIKIDRVRANTARTTESIPVADTSDLQAVRKSLAEYPVLDGDRVFVAPILPYSERAVYIEGHVIRPGKFAYRDDMMITDVLHSYADLLPEPADRAEIVRLRPPDYRPETIQFNLSEVMIGNAQIRLQPFDTIRVLGRYDLDAPKVTIQGEVLRPGSYPMTDKMTAAQLVRLAGGFKRAALRDHADLTSYELRQGNSVNTHRTSIDIGRAVEGGDAAADVALQAGDVLTIHQIAGWSDIGASVTLGGEVVYPGTYGIQSGERLSSVLKRAGGFREAAYPSGAVLTRTQVHDLQEKSRAELIRQIEATSAATKVSPTQSSSEQTATLQLIVQQQQQVLQRLKSEESSGRMVIKIDADIASWENTPADIEVRAGDVLTVPKRPGFVLVTGQVYNSAAITYEPGKNADWYLRRSGGPTEMANKKDIFIIRANGSVVGRDSTEWFGDDVRHTRLDPGDVVVVPQKIIGGSVFWRNLLATAQFLSSFAITAKVVGY